MPTKGHNEKSAVLVLPDLQQVLQGRGMRGDAKKGGWLLRDGGAVQG
jgi:hypothetical protein